MRVIELNIPSLIRRYVGATNKQLTIFKLNCYGNLFDCAPRSILDGVRLHTGADCDKDSSTGRFSAAKGRPIAAKHFVTLSNNIARHGASIQPSHGQDYDVLTLIHGCLAIVFYQEIHSTAILIIQRDIRFHLFRSCCAGDRNTIR